MLKFLRQLLSKPLPNLEWLRGELEDFVDRDPKQDLKRKRFTYPNPGDHNPPNGASLLYPTLKRLEPLPGLHQNPVNQFNPQWQIPDFQEIHLATNQNRTPLEKMVLDPTS